MNAARAIVLGENLENTTAATRNRAAARTGVALFYAVKGQHDRDMTIGFYLLPPLNKIKDKIKWGVRVKDAADQPIVEVPPKS